MWAHHESYPWHFHDPIWFHPRSGQTGHDAFVPGSSKRRRLGSRRLFKADASCVCARTRPLVTYHKPKLFTLSTYSPFSAQVGHMQSPPFARLSIVHNLYDIDMRHSPGHFLERLRTLCRFICNMSSWYYYLFSPQFDLNPALCFWNNSVSSPGFINDYSLVLSMSPHNVGWCR